MFLDITMPNYHVPWGQKSPSVDNYWIKENKDTVNPDFICVCILCIFVFRYLKPTLVSMPSFTDSYKVKYEMLHNLKKDIIDLADVS